MNKSEIIKWFMDSFPELVKEMQESDHNFDKDNLNPYHMEGSIWTHTCLVVNAAQEGHHNILAALLHDIGKPMCEERVEDKKRVRFFNHESMSAFMALDVMKKFEEDFKIKLFKKELFQAIALHTEPFKLSNEKLDERLVNQDKSFLHMLKVLNEADADGRFYFAGDSERYWEPQAKTREITPKPKTATVLIGLPCSGKSSYIRTLDPETSHSVISRDDILMKFPGETYDEKWKNADQKKVDKIFQDWKKRCVESGDDLIFDLTHMSRKSRRRSIHNLPSDYKKKAIVFMPTLTEIAERSRKRSKTGKSIGGDVYEKMVCAFYPPMYDEFDEIEWRFE